MFAYPEEKYPLVSLEWFLLSIETIENPKSCRHTQFIPFYSHLVSNFYWSMYFTITGCSGLLVDEMGN